MMRGGRGFPLFKYLFVEPTRTRRSGCAGEGINNVKKGAYLGLSNEGSVADPAREVRVFNRHSVYEGQSELAAEFAFIQRQVFVAKPKPPRRTPEGVADKHSETSNNAKSPERQDAK